MAKVDKSKLQQDYQRDRAHYIRERREDAQRCRKAADILAAREDPKLRVAINLLITRSEELERQADNREYGKLP